MHWDLADVSWHWIHSTLQVFFKSALNNVQALMPFFKVIYVCKSREADLQQVPVIRLNCSRDHVYIHSFCLYPQFHWNSVWQFSSWCTFVQGKWDQACSCAAAHSPSPTFYLKADYDWTMSRNSLAHFEKSGFFLLLKKVQSFLDMVCNCQQF